MFKSRLTPLCRRYGSISVNGSNPDRLRILFCGSDEFSLPSLAALYKLSIRSSTQQIESIDVLVRDEKPSGRGLAAQRDIPTVKFATSNSLDHHKTKDFNDWEPHKEYNLIVAVSFGLFIPSRILKAALYGGLNVHPSLLPKYRGAAPLQNAFLNKDTTTGVTLQTLDLHKFDHGSILLQTKPLEFAYRQEKQPLSTGVYAKQLSILADRGAELLVRGIEEKLYMSPASHAIESPYQPSRAPALRKELGLLKFSIDTASDIFHKAIVANIYCYRRDIQTGKTQRIQFFGIRTVDNDSTEYTQDMKKAEAGSFGAHADEMWVKIGQDESIFVNELQLESKRAVHAAEWVTSVTNQRKGKKYDFCSEPGLP